MRQVDHVACKLMNIKNDALLIKDEIYARRQKTVKANQKEG